MSITRYFPYVEDDDGHDLFISHQADANGRWVRYADHAAEVERLTAALDEARAALKPSDEQLDTLASVVHDTYEAAAARTGWQTNPASRRPWADVPEANRTATRAAIRAALDHLRAALEAAEQETARAT